MKLRGLEIVFTLLVVAVCAVAQQPASGDSAAPALSVLGDAHSSRFDLTNTPAPPPRMSPDLALQSYQANAVRQLTAIGASEDKTIVEATLPGTGQKGRFELRRSFLAPKSLAYGAIKFVGDSFVKTNIIVKLLQSEVDHVEKGEGASTAITAENYKFNYKGTQQINGVSAYEFHVKPRKKRPGLFKGKIYLDPSTGHIVRAEGSLVKSPSVFVKKVEFTQDYEDVAGFSLPARMHSVSQTRLFGKAIVDIEHSDYRAVPLEAKGDSQATLSITSGPANR